MVRFARDLVIFDAEIHAHAVRVKIRLHVIVIKIETNITVKIAVIIVPGIALDGTPHLFGRFKSLPNAATPDLQ